MKYWNDLYSNYIWKLRVIIGKYNMKMYRVLQLLVKPFIIQFFLSTGYFMQNKI